MAYLSAAGREELPALTGLRFVAAMMVALSHASPFMPVIGPPFTHAYLGVDLFFILSGFVIAHVYWQDFSPPSRAGSLRFIGLRLARLWPAHMAAVFLFIAATLYAGQTQEQPVDWSLIAPELATHFFLAHNWGFTGIVKLNYPSWSVSAEFAAYLTFPLLALLFAKLRGTAALLLAIVLLLFACWLVICVGFGEPWGTPTPVGTFRALFEFAVGVALWRLWREKRLATLPWPAIAVLALAGIALILAVARPIHWSDGFVALLMAVLLLALAHQRGMLARALSWRPVVYLGEISYSIYLMHILAIMVTQWLMVRIPHFGERKAGWDITAFYAVVAIGCGALLFHAVEKPMRRFLRARIDRALPARPA